MQDITEGSMLQWPAEVIPVLEHAITCEFATLTRQGLPITYPLTPYVGNGGSGGSGGRTLDVSTGLTYPAKAERARRNSKVAMLYSDMLGSGLTNPPTVLVYGMASVRDADLQANTDRYVQATFQKLPAAYRGVPKFMLRASAWYFARIWIEVTPLRILWWPEGDLDLPPQSWEAPAGLQAPPSDPTPTGHQPAAWKSASSEWQSQAAYAFKHLGLPVLTMLGEDGFPMPMRVKQVVRTAQGFRLELPAALLVQANGVACLTFHSHPQAFTTQQNRVFVGEVIRDNAEFTFKVERVLGDFSLGTSRLTSACEFMASRNRLAPRLKAEAARRGQPVPVVHLPGDSK